MNATRQRTLNASNHKVSSRVTGIAVAADNLRPRLSVLLSRVVNAACLLSFHSRDSEKFSLVHLLIYPLLTILHCSPLQLTLLKHSQFSIPVRSTANSAYTAAVQNKWAA